MPPHGAARARLQTALTGTTAIAFVLCLSRWGTTFGVGPLYFTDIMLALAVVHAAFTHRPSSPFAAPSPEFGFRSVPVVHWLLLVFVVVRALTSFQTDLAADWIRDVVPYLYGFVALLSAGSFQASDEHRRARTARILVGALVIHLLWTGLVVLTPLGADFSLKQQIGGATLLQVRPDIDAALNSVLAGICLQTLLRKRRPLIAAAGLLASAGVVLSLATRAGTLSLIAVLVVSFGLSYSRTARDKSRGWLVLTAGFLVLAALAVLPATTPGQRILSTLIPDTATTGQQFNAQGTEAARNLVWTGVIDWTLETPARAVLGGGFGNNFLEQSGTLHYLEGTEYTGVRSPHDWFVGTFARIGMLGLLLLVGSLIAGLAAVVRRRYEVAMDPLAPVAAMMVVSVIPIASLGVVAEAPFGAVPLFWALGILFSYRGRPQSSSASASAEARSGARIRSASR